MNIRFEPVAPEEARESVQRHLTSLPSAIDSFLEDHIAGSAPYWIRVGDAPAGLAAVHGGSLLTLFALETPFKHAGQRVFREARRLEQVQAAFVPTCDEFFLSHALDDCRLLTKQAYFFAADPAAPAEDAPDGFALRPAGVGDIALIRDASGDFFGDIAGCVAKGELFLTRRAGACVGFGILDRSELCGPAASIGMFTRAEFRRQGVGTATLRLLQAECRREGLRPLAGCWYYNHASKRTLERAGLFAQTRLLRIDY